MFRGICREIDKQSKRMLNRDSKINKLRPARDFGLPASELNSPKFIEAEDENHQG
jgi:hypothetical protein